MHLVNTMLCERKQPQHTTDCVCPFLGNIQNRQIHRGQKKKKIVDLWSLGAEDLGEEMENDF